MCVGARKWVVWVLIYGLVYGVLCVLLGHYLFVVQETVIYPDLFLKNAVGTLFKRVVLLLQNYQRKLS